MGVTLQLILGILLALSQCSTTNTINLRQIREAPPPPPSPTTIQNVTEINNRDLNKIVKDNPKTETVDSKAKFVNNVHSYAELPLKLASNEDQARNNAKKNKTEEAETSKEETKKSITKLDKEKRREENSRAIDASKFWSDDFHSKNVFTLPLTPEKFQEPTDIAFDVSKLPTLDSQPELTTPTIQIFHQKSKETVESVEQNIEDDSDDFKHRDADSEERPIKDTDLNVDDPLEKPDNESLDLLKSKTLVNNETVDKNSIHREVNLEQTKTFDYQNTFNDTKVYDEDTIKGETFEPNSTERVTTSSTTTSVSSSLTRKSSLLKENLNEKISAQILSNNIETETKKPIKDIITSTTVAPTVKEKGELQDILITTTIPAIETSATKSQSTTTIISTVSTPPFKLNVSDQENVIPLHFSSESTPVPESFSEIPPIVENSTISLDKNDSFHSIETRIAIDKSTESDLTTEIITSTELLETTTTFLDSQKKPFDGITTTSPEDGTTSFIVENATEVSDPTTEMPTSTGEDTTVLVEDSTGSTSTTGTTVQETIANDSTTTENGRRTSKSLENSMVTEYMVKVNETIVENTTKGIEAGTESTLKNELYSTTLNDEGKIESESTDPITEKTKVTEETTTEKVVPTSTITNVEVTTLENTSQIVEINVTTQKVTKGFETTTEAKTTLNVTEQVPESTYESVKVSVTTGKITESPEVITETKMTTSTTEKGLEVFNTTSEIKTTTNHHEPSPTTTEYSFVHIEKTANNRTTLLPEVLSPNLNYSTTVTIDNEAIKIKKVDVDEHGFREDSSGSTSTTGATIQEITANGSTTTDDGSETTQDGFSKDSGGGDKGKIAAIVISSVGAVCLVLLAGLLYVMKKRQKRLNYGPRCRPVSLDEYSIDNLSGYNSVRRKGGARLSKRSFGNPAFEDPVAPTHPLNFPALAKFSSNFEDIKAEFEDIPQISARTSELPDGCETKNRYANVIPLPETRVYLKSIDGYPNSDYINANYVTGPKNTKGYYIATQGPMQNTVDDFWRMIWEQQTKVVLMLTHLVENGLEKCVDYLPESEIVDCSRLFGDFQIILKKQEVKDKYIISTLQLKNMVSNSWREVTHFWYLGWPEKGVPAEGNSLIAFLIEARSYMKTATIDKRDGLNGIQNGGAQNEHNPVVIHCSPGTGRTGVAIACDIAIREFETTRLVDIPKIVYRIRRDRAGAVQTKEQYTFIYKVVSLYATKLTGEALENF